MELGVLEIFDKFREEERGELGRFDEGAAGGGGIEKANEHLAGAGIELAVWDAIQFGEEGEGFGFEVEIAAEAEHVWAVDAGNENGFV